MTRALLLCLSILTSQALNAQTVEMNEWRFLIRDFPDNRLAWQLGSTAHQPDPAYYEHLGNYLYPGGDTVGELDFICLPAGGGLPYDLPRTEAEFWLQQAKTTVEWYRSNGFQPFGSEFNIVPEVMHRSRISRQGSLVDDFAPTGRTVNLLVCSESGYISVNRVDYRLQSNKLEIGPGMKYLEHHLPARQATLAHEFTHVYQNITVPIRRLENGSETAADGLLDGAAEATALRFAFDQHAGLEDTLSHRDMRSFGDPFSRRFFMLRPYSLPLQATSPDISGNAPDTAGESESADLAAAIDARIDGLYGHQTGGFYYHLIERYLDGSPGRLTTLYELIGDREKQNIYPALDTFLDRIDGTTMKGLEHVFPQFLTEYAEWWSWRTADRISENQWLNAAFGGCRRIELNSQNAAGSAEVDIQPFAGGCFDVVLSGDLLMAAPELELLVTARNGSARSVYMGLSRASGLESGPISCHEGAEGTSSTMPAPCLLLPLDGNVNRATGLLQAGIARAFHLGPMLGSKAGDVALRLVVAHMPRSLSAGQNTGLESNRFRLAVAADSTVIEGPGISRPVAGDQPFRASGPFVVSARDRLRPEVRENIRITGLERIVEMMQDFAEFMPFSGQSERDAWSGLFLIQTRTDDGQVATLGVLPSEPIAAGQYGVFDAEGTLGTTNHSLGSQQPGKPSQIEILQNDADQLRYRAEIHLCVDDLIGTDANEPADSEAQCAGGRPVTYRVDSTIAFPGLLPDSASGPSGFTALPNTTRYDEYRNLRLSSSSGY